MRAILTYHSIDDSGSPVSLAPAAFAAHVRWLASARVRVLTLDALVAASVSPVSASDASNAGDAVALTFDDGFVNFAEHAAPLLREHGLPATIFVVSRHVGATNAWGGRRQPGIPTLPLLSWDSLGRLAESTVAIGGHTRTHARLGALSASEADDEIIGGVEDIRARLGLQPTAFAYPYGDAPDAAVTTVRRHFAAGVTTALRELGTSEDPAALPRLDAYHLRQPGRLESWGSPAFRINLRVRAAARAVRRACRAGIPA